MLCLVNHTTFAGLSEQDNTPINAALVAGSGHLPDLFARMMTMGFSITQVSKDNESPLSEDLVGAIFGFELERKAYKDIRGSILGSVSENGSWHKVTFQQQYIEAMKINRKPNTDTELALLDKPSIDEHVIASVHKPRR